MSANRQSALDYFNHIDLRIHDDWEAFCAATKGRRLVLMTSHGAHNYYQ